MRNTFISILTLILLSGAALAAEKSNGSLSSEVLSNDRITAISQDSQGHIWIGTFRGLNRYDSHIFHQYFCSSDENAGLPDNQIQSLLTDRSGRLWVGTVNGICRYCDDDSFRFVPVYGAKSFNVLQILESHNGVIVINTADAICVYKPESDCFESRLSIYSNNWATVSKAFISPDDRLWMVGDRLYCYNMDSFRLEGSYELPGKSVASCIMATDGKIWIGQECGLCVFDTAAEQFYEISPSEKAKLPKSVITQMFLCSGCVLMYSDSEGVFSYNEQTARLTAEGEADFEFEIPDFTLNAVFEDRDSNIWWCSYDQGFSISYAYKERFGNKLLNASLKGKSITAMDCQGDVIYLADIYGNIYRYDTVGGSLQTLALNTDERKQNIYITSLEVEREGRLWVGTYNKLMLCEAQGGKLDIVRSLDKTLALCLKKDIHGNIWTSSTDGKIIRVRPDGMDIIDLGIPPESYSFVGGLEIMPNGNIVAALFRYGLFEIDSKTLEAKKMNLRQEDWDTCITRSVFIPSCMKTDRLGDLWIGTVANGLLKYESASGRLSRLHGTPCDDICSVEEDWLGNVWVSTQSGLAKYDRTVNRFFNWFKADGTGGNQFYDRASGTLEKGPLVFGGTHGITLFDPVEVVVQRNVPLYFEGLKVNNEPVEPSEDGCIAKAMTFNPPLRLKYEQNSFGISFTALDYSEYERVRYSYMLEGFDRYWIDAGSNREANYANIGPGKYRFKVRLSNIDHKETIAENSLDITIERPPYRRWWAYALYFLLISLIVWTIILNRRRLQEERLAKKQAALEREQEKRVNEMNMSFFANISHEFRTPLTMISAPVVQLSESDSIDDEGKRLLDIVSRNISRMLRLVNQLLDFNKLENDTLKLKVKKVDVVSLLNYMIDMFSINAREKGINLVSWGVEDSLMVWMDEDKLDKICFNLLSNAMKFTGSGGKIEISLDFLTREDASGIVNLSERDKDSRYLKICVKDTGPGIPEDQLEKIFERYYQLDNNVRGAYNWGTGIGLYYARSLARIHHGWLVAANRTDVQGASFTLLLPASESSYSEEEKARDNEADFVREKAVRLPEAFDEEKTSSHRHTVLIVDDDTDVIRYMKELLSAHYNVICEYDADSAFLDVKKEAPDILISDVMMPGRTGYDLCRDIKGSLQLSHIPVILLTAKANVEDQVQGLDCGADAYVTKPFEPQYLLALVNSQIRNREKIKSLLSQATEVSSIDENVLSEQDNAFMKDLYELMENELSNDELDVTGMTERLHISRTKFYYKVKGLTGENPSVFFKRYKLNRAAQLLREHKYNISEIADMTGFSSLSHFSTSFKKQFGISPSEFLKPGR